jgi:hypothetical protein
MLLRHVAAAAAVMNCLQDFREEIRSDACKSQVHKYVELAAQDIRFDVQLADACYNDRMTLCAAVPPVSLPMFLYAARPCCLPCLFVSWLAMAVSGYCGVRQSLSAVVQQHRLQATDAHMQTAMCPLLLLWTRPWHVASTCTEQLQEYMVLQQPVNCLG